MSSTTNCYKCHQEIGPRSPAASYENKSYHPSCLTCNICFKSISGEKFFKDKNQNLICDKCDQKYGPKCTKCKQSFKAGEPYKKLEDNIFYHYECFTCCGPCRKPIGAEFYDLDQGKFLCTDCYAKYGVRSNYNDIKVPSPVNEAVMSTKPPPDTRPSDRDLNKLASNFSDKLHTSPPPPSLPSRPPPTYEPPPKEYNKPAGSVVVEDDSKKALKCDKCGLLIDGAYSVYDGKSYHNKCFTCSRCKKEFTERQFFRINGLPACAPCHEKHLVDTSSKCKKCKKPILDTVLKFMGEEYHEYCLTCTACERKLNGTSIYTNKEKSPFCLDCYTLREAKRCEKCAKPIAPNQSNVIFEEKPYHKECFTCGKCKRPISSDESFFKGNSGSVICEQCAN